MRRGSREKLSSRRRNASAARAPVAMSKRFVRGVGVPVQVRAADERHREPMRGADLVHRRGSRHGLDPDRRLPERCLEGIGGSVHERIGEVAPVGALVRLDALELDVLEAVGIEVLAKRRLDRVRILVGHEADVEPGGRLGRHDVPGDGAGLA